MTMFFVCSMNSLFKPYLPVDKEGFPTIDNPMDILQKEISLSPLIRALKKADNQSQVQQSDEVIVLTDDESTSFEDDSLSNPGTSSSTYSCNDEMIDDFDWYSSSSQQDTQSPHSEPEIETLSLDSPPSYKRASSLSSLDSCDLNLDTASSLDTERIDAANVQETADKEQTDQMMRSTSALNLRLPEINGDYNQNLPTLNESAFNRLMNDINSTTVSIPSNGNISELAENGESSQVESSDGKTGKAQSWKSNGVANEKVNGTGVHRADLMIAVTSPTNGGLSIATVDSEHEMGIDDEAPSSVFDNHIDVKLPEGLESIRNCDNNSLNIISSSPLKNHDEILKNAEAGLDNHHKSAQESAPVESSKAIGTFCPAENKSVIPNQPADSQSIRVRLASKSGSAAVIENPSDWAPAAESSMISELLSKSEQETLDKDGEACLTFTDLWSNGPAADDTVNSKIDGNKSQPPPSDSPPTFLPNGFDPSVRLKTYSRRSRKLATDIATISTTSSQSSSSLVTTLDESTPKRDKYLLPEAMENDDDLFLRDIFSTNDFPRPGDSPRVRLFTVGQVCSTPIPSTSVAPSPSIVSSGGEVAEIVKRKRGRPRKYPLPEAGITPPSVPKPVRVRKPRTPKPPPDPNTTDDEPVFEKKQLRERKPKIQPPPKEPAKKPPKRSQRVTRQNVQKKSPAKTEADEAKARRRRRNTIKMTIDAIFNTQSPKMRAIQARRISQILGIPFGSPQIATILKRINYNKSMSEVTDSINSSHYKKIIFPNRSATDSSLNESSLLKSFKNRPNGQLSSTANADTPDTPDTNNQNTTETTAQTTIDTSTQDAAKKDTSSVAQGTSSTILARKSYIKPNLTISSYSSFSSALRRISFSGRRLSFSSSLRHSRLNNPRKLHSQHYAKIDVFDVSKGRRSRKKGTKDSAPRKKSSRRRQVVASIAADINPVVVLGDKVDAMVKSTEKLADFTPIRLNATNEFKIKFSHIQTALSSTQHGDSELNASRQRILLSEDTETDVTNEFTTDPESAVEDTDDSHTRKSQRHRKRPKILDL